MYTSDDNWDKFLLMDCFA